MDESNGTKALMDAGEPTFGAWLASMSPRVAEVLAATGVDWVGIDMEHTPISARRAEACIRAVERHATPIVRLPSPEQAAANGIKHALDSGAGGVMVPGVESAETAERVVSAAKFPPDGTRGVAGTTRANGYGTDFDGYVSSANDETFVVVQVESAAAVERCEEILAVDGIDVAFVGENDLSSTYGHPGEKDRPEVREAVDRVFAAAEAADVHNGIAGRTPADMADRIDRGYRFFLLGADVKFMRTALAEFLPD